jgi:hypothetical protein
LNINSFTIDWVGTQLTYVAAVARGFTKLHILVFKHNENKFKHMYSIHGLCPNVADQEEPEKTAGQTYSEFPM